MEQKGDASLILEILLSVVLFTFLMTFTLYTCIINTRHKLMYDTLSTCMVEVSKAGGDYTNYYKVNRTDATMSISQNLQTNLNKFAPNSNATITVDNSGHPGSAIVTVSWTDPSFGTLSLARNSQISLTGKRQKISGEIDLITKKGGYLN